MSRPTVALLLFMSLSGTAFAKCVPPDFHKLVWIRKIDKKTLPPGVEIVDRVWIRNVSATELITYTPEKGARLRTNYRSVLGDVPTTDNELPGTKLINGQRYEYNFPVNPDFSGNGLKQSGWVRQDYEAGLIQPPVPVLPPKIEDRIFSGKSAGVAVTIPIPIYYGGKRSKIDFVFEFTKNLKYGIVDPNCPPEK